VFRGWLRQHGAKLFKLKSLKVCQKRTTGSPASLTHRFAAA